MMTLVGYIVVALIYIAQFKLLGELAATDLNSNERKRVIWMNIISFSLSILALAISYLLRSQTVSAVMLFDISFFSRLIVGCAMLGYGLTLAGKSAHRYLVRSSLLLSAAMLVPALVELARVKFG